MPGRSARRRAREEGPLDVRTSVAQGLGVFRWAAWVWVALVVVLSPADVVRPWLAALMLATSFAFTAFAWIGRKRPDVVLRPIVVAVELTIGAAMLAVDGLVRPDGQVFDTGQSLASVWPLTGVIAAAIVIGPGSASVAGLVLGACRYASTVVNGVTDYGQGRVLSLMSTAVMYALAGAAFGYVYRLLREAREAVAVAETREEMARTLHDGVLQTLALVERRADDSALARLARDQERELRAYLFGDQQAPQTLAAGLRHCASKFEERFTGRVDVIVGDGTETLRRDIVDAVVGAAGEALTNAGKHGGASRVTVYADVDEHELLCSVRDDGRGYDPATTTPGVGMSRSIVERVASVGGTVAVTAAAGEGVEVAMRVPAG